MNWKQYQEQTAALFRNLGCEVSVEEKVHGTRAEHSIDVLVRFKKFGLETTWVIECKHWKSAVTKEKVLVLRSVVEDVGADRGILISVAGYQSGAIRAAEKTNITLTDLDDLKETAQEELLYSVLYRIETRAIELKYLLYDLYITKKTGPHSWVSKPRTGVNDSVVTRTMGKLAILDFGFDRVRLKKPPYPVGFDQINQRKIFVQTVDEFIASASEVLRKAELTLKKNSKTQRAHEKHDQSTIPPGQP